jgi:hypothetical protein
MRRSSSSRLSDLTRDYGETHLVEHDIGENGVEHAGVATLFIESCPAFASLPQRTQKGKSCRRLVQHLPGTFRDSSWFVSTSQLNAVMEIAFVHRVKLLPALTSEIRRVTGDDRDRHLIRPLNASLRGSLCSGSRFAVVSREAVSEAATTESSV